MWTAIIGILKALTGFGDTVKGISHDIAQAKIEAIKAGTDERKIAAEERTKALEARRDVLISESSAGSRLNIFMRAFLGFPAGIVLWKILIWDKALGQWTGGHTDELTPEQWWVVTAAIGFYFLAETARAIRK
jgi:hypothetical protein